MKIFIADNFSAVIDIKYVITAKIKLNACSSL